MAEYHNIGVVLSGGGAKGAYQIGAFKALAEAGMMSRVRYASGASIGALNALLLANGSPVIWRLVWKKLSEGIGSPATKPETPTVEGCGMAATLAKVTALPGVLRGRVELYACAYCVEDEAPEYFKLNGRTASEAGLICAASCALPSVSPYVLIGNKRYCDGGMVPKEIHKDNADKIPARPLWDKGCDLVLVSYLIPTDRADLSGFPEGTRILELRPSHPLEAYPGEGTLDFSPERLREHRRLGYDDTRAALRELQGC